MRDAKSRCESRCEQQARTAGVSGGGDRPAWPHRRRGLDSDGVRYAGARSSVGRRFRSVTKLRLELYGGVFLLLQQRSKHPREMVITPKASTSFFDGRAPFPRVTTTNAVSTYLGAQDTVKGALQQLMNRYG